MIGVFGDVIFETSDKRIYNFSGFSRDVESRSSEHEIIGEKPIDEFVGPGLDTISFTISLKSSLGVNVREEMNRWVQMTRDGEAHVLIIGDRPIGVDMWKVQSISEAWDTLTNNGILISGKIDVTFKEYISRM